MNRHQVLTGAANAGDHCYAVGSVEGVHFTAYATGCDVVILASDFQRVQIIAGAVHGSVQVSCIDCCSDAGKIAACYGRKVEIFEPVPLLQHESQHKLDYQWYHTGSLETQSDVSCLSWNQDGTRLLTAGAMLQLWEAPGGQESGGHEGGGQEEPVEFFIDDGGHTADDGVPVWRALWEARPATPVTHVAFSPDGLLFATVGMTDRLVKIWYENKKVQLPLVRTESVVSPKKDETHFSFIYISHPRAVSGFSWRKSSKYMPRGSVANMLMTSCEDNICRVWCETILPEDGLVDVQQLNPAGLDNLTYHTQRHSKHFIQRLHHIRNVMYRRKRGPSSATLPPLPSALSQHDFHKFGLHPNSVALGLHFHLAASINPETDIPLLPVGDLSCIKETRFHVHWLNNKELNFTHEAEKILAEMNQHTTCVSSSATGEELSGEEGEGKTEEPAPLHPLAGMPSEPVIREALARHKRGLLRKTQSYMSTESERSVASSYLSSTAATEVTTNHQPPSTKTGTGVDPLDHKIEVLLQDWHQGADMLFSVHPLDGSFLVWLVDWLDEPSPGCFRQAQVSFSSRIPQALPVCDANTMSHTLLLYSNYGHIDLKSVLKASESLVSKMYEPSEKSGQPFITSSKYTANAMGKSSPGQCDNTLAPNVLMLSKHNNGSLNLWQISFAEHSAFSTVLSIAHASRVCGHRFQTNNVACHPVLPLLLTTSHHNQPPEATKPACSHEAFCSELILWRVDPVGPLSKSGGISELARINSPRMSAFASVAWLPTLLPSSTLGSLSNSPSALFVATDGDDLRLYQAVIDSRTLLTQSAPRRRPRTMSKSSTGTSSSDFNLSAPSAREVFNIVSSQSTARPGCVIELDTVVDSRQAWHQLELMHVFQEQMIVGGGSQPGGHGEALVDLEDSGVFHEHFYLVAMEKLSGGDRTCLLHMWRITIASSQNAEDGVRYSPDVVYYQDDDDAPPQSPTPAPTDPTDTPDTRTPRLAISSVKVCTQTLDLPPGVDVVCASVAAGHLSSSSIYPACFAPYLLTTACSDHHLRFWRCRVDRAPELSKWKFSWLEWEMMIRTEDTGAIKIPGKPIQVCCAYNGRVAVAYRMGGPKSCGDNSNNKFINLFVSLYECESTGGSEWTLEDTIELKNITIPDPKINIDLSLIYDNDETVADPKAGHGSQVLMTSTTSTPAIVKTTIPSPTTVQSVRRFLSDKDSKMNVLRQRHLVQLDWVSTEDGSHILTVGVGPKILLYAAVSSEISQATQMQKDEGSKSRQKTRGILQKSKSLTVQNFVEEIRWMKIRSIELSTMDGLPTLPMHMSWVRDGMLVVGMDNEVHVYSQWRGPGEGLEGGDSEDSTDLLDTRTLTEYSLQKVASSASLHSKPFKISPSVSSVKLDASISNLSILAAGDRKDRDKRKLATSGKADQLPSSDSMLNLQVLQDCGLFEAARLANPVLPQYHPKQLMELLNFGKIRRVKAILAHLIRCISGNDSQEGGVIISHETSQNRPRLSTHSASIAGSPHDPGSSKIPEETHRDYIEICSIPPLPLYALLAADQDSSFKNIEAPSPNRPTADSQDYSTLFNVTVDTELDDPFDNNEVFNPSPKTDKRRASSYTMGHHYFGPTQARRLTRHLTHTQLPGLSSLDQMYLLALADTVANTHLDFSEKHASDIATKNTLARELGQSEAVNTDSVDDCGLRYLLAARHHVYLLNTLPLRQRALVQKQGLSPAYTVWAFHSEATEELLNVLPSVQRGEPSWSELRQFGAGWWITNISTLKRCIEKVAKAAFQVKQDPLDAALFYIALRKKTLIWGLFRSVNDSRMQQFFRNNFSEDRWRKAALKNAFALLGRQRFHHAAAFFLLAGNVRDAIEVCINKLDDLQLAMVVARLYDGDEAMPSSLRRLLWEECLGCDRDGQCYDPSLAHPDPFVRSMAYWMFKDYSASLGTLLETGLGSGRRMEGKEDTQDIYSTNPSVFNFYNYLRTHPLIVRQQLALTAADKSQTVLLSGFSHGAQVSEVGDKNVTYVDRITPVERRLYFMTAHAHFKAGCPALALEVLSKLPSIIDTEHDITKSHSTDNVPSQSINTGQLDKTQTNNGLDWSQPVSKPADSVSGLDWSQPVSKPADTAGGLDWSQPVNKPADTAADLDWSQPISKPADTAAGFDWGAPISKPADTPLSLDWSQPVSCEDDTDTKSDSEVESKEKLGRASSGEGRAGAGPRRCEDIMAQQLKFIACLKIMMEEVSTLATGFEVDGGQLRFQLYIWLEKEVDVLKALSNYGGDSSESALNKDVGSERESATEHNPAHLTTDPASKPTLHEIILAEKLDFEAKLERMARRKQWLKTHQQLLRTLLSFSVLHGSCGGGLASVRMELILLLQELQQNKTSQKQLLSPLPFPTSLPLLSASVASAKTVISSPIRHLQAQTQDILHTIVEMQCPPASGSDLSHVCTLRNLSAALSACIYQCLCDSDSFVVSLSDAVDVGMEGFTSTNVVYKDSYLMAGAQRRRQVLDSDDKPNSQPSKWPGVSTLRSLLARERDEDLPKLPVLLVEALVSVYLSLLTHALATYDANILYRLVGRSFSESVWAVLFGGGVKKLIKLSASSVTDMHARVAQSKDEMSRQRMKLHMRVMGTAGPTPNSAQQRLKEDKPTYKERFLPPEVSMISYFMTKPYIVPDESNIDYDSAESLSSEEEEDDDDLRPRSKRAVEREEHLDPASYSWCLLRYAIIKFIRLKLLLFLPTTGLELTELPVASPLLQALLRTLEQWEGISQARLELYSGPPTEYIPGCYVETAVNGPTMLKYKALLEPHNTPFISSHYSALPAKRLWHFLVKQSDLHDVFIRYVFKRRRPVPEEPEVGTDEGMSGVPTSTTAHTDPMKIIHKDQDVILSFCVNQANLHCIALATQKEVIEMDISGILSPPTWLEDSVEYDITTINQPTPNKLEPEEFLLVQTAADRVTGAPYGVPTLPPTAPGVLPAPTQMAMSQTGRGGSVLKGISIPGLTNALLTYYVVDRSRRLMRRLTKRPVSLVKRMGAHPNLPYYLTGCQDGSVRLWEWGHSQHIAVARQPGSFPKVSKVLFNAQGNKFGVADGEGTVCLWQVGLGVNMSKPYLSLKCNSKTTSDFVFVGSSSLIASAGHSSDGRNVCLWDTLLPQRSSLVQSFSTHADGSSAILYAPQHQLLITAGKHGEVSLLDVRQRQLRHTFQAHDTAIRCLALDPMEEYFVTGAADGDIKVWGLMVHNLLDSFPGEHTKGSIFRNMGSSGVTQLAVNNKAQLFSCGTDGSLKVRQLPARDTIVHSYTAATAPSVSGGLSQLAA